METIENRQECCSHPIHAVHFIAAKVEYAGKWPSEDGGVKVYTAKARLECRCCGKSIELSSGRFMDYHSSVGNDRPTD